MDNNRDEKSSYPLLSIIIYYKLQNKKEDEIANLLGISQSAVNQRTKTAQWYAIEKLIKYFETTIQNWIK